MLLRSLKAPKLLLLIEHLMSFAVVSQAFPLTLAVGRRGIPPSAQDLGRKASDEVRHAFGQIHTVSSDLLRKLNFHETPLPQDLQTVYEGIMSETKSDLKVPSENRRIVRDPLRKSFSA